MFKDDFVEWLLVLFLFWLIIGLSETNKKLDILIELFQPEEQTEKLSIEDLETGPPMLMIG